jgi:hypothetical protein
VDHIYASILEHCDRSWNTPDIVDQSYDLHDHIHHGHLFVHHERSCSQVLPEEVDQLSQWKSFLLQELKERKVERHE